MDEINEIFPSLTWYGLKFKTKMLNIVCLKRRDEDETVGNCFENNVHDSF